MSDRQTRGGKALWFPIWIDQFFGDGDLDAMTPSQRDLLFHLWGLAWGSRWPGVIGTPGDPWTKDRIAAKCRRIGGTTYSDFCKEYVELSAMHKLDHIPGGYVRIPSVVKRLPRYLRSIYDSIYKKHTGESAGNLPNELNSSTREELRGTQRNSEKPDEKEKEVATAGEAPAVAPRFTIPKPIADIAGALKITGFCAKKLRDGYPARRLLAWLLAMGEAAYVQSACAWLTAVLKDGKEPRQDLMDRAKSLLDARAEQIAAAAPPPPAAAQSAMAGAVRHMMPPRSEGFSQKKNRVVNELRDAEGGGR